MRIRHLSAAVLLGLAAVMTSVAPAHAVEATYPPQGDGVAVSDPEVAPGGSVTVRAGGFRPGSPVTFVLTLVAAGRQAAGGGTLTETATADSNGVAAATFEVPDGVSGTIPVTATGVAPDGSTRAVTGSINVVAAGAGGALPKTGGNLTALYIGGAVILIGIALIVVARRRRSTGGASGHA